MKGFHTIKRINLYEQVADQMEKMILDDMNVEWEEGSKLPSEQELAESFGVSRNIIREAIKLLKERGLVDPKNGLGVYVTRPDAEQLSSLIYRYTLMNSIDIIDIYEVRIMIETTCVEKVARHCKQEHIVKMKELLEIMEDRTISVNERREADFDFHVEIAKATQNSLMSFIIMAMKDTFLASMEKGIVMTGGIEDACERHARIMRAIEAHDAEEARKAMRDHLVASMDNVNQYNRIAEEKE